MTEMFDMFSSNFVWCHESVYLQCWLDYVIQSGWRDQVKHDDTLNGETKSESCAIYILTTNQIAIQQAIMLIPAWSLINLNTARKYLCKYELAINVLFSVAAPGVCSFEGQFLPVTGNRCVYIECVVVREPWQDAQGNIQLDMIQRQCAGGSGLPLNYVTGTENPCTVMLAECAPCEC